MNEKETCLFVTSILIIFIYEFIKEIEFVFVVIYYRYAKEIQFFIVLYWEWELPIHSKSGYKSC